MHEPMVWNNLDEAAAWLTEATNTEWSVKQVLDVVLTNYKKMMRDLYRPNAILPRRVFGQKHRNPHITCLEALMPRGTEFGRYEADEARVQPDNPRGLVRKFSEARQNVELTEVDVKQLLLYGEVRVGIAKYPDPTVGMGKNCVLVEPVDKEHIVTLDMVGISREDLEMLAAEFPNTEEAQPLLEKTNEGSNTKRWTDEKLKALWEESLLPGITYEALGEKYGVSRQRIGKQIERAKLKFSKMGGHPKKAPTLDTLIHKMKK